MPLPSRCQQHPQPRVVSTKSVTDIAQCPQGRESSLVKNHCFSSTIVFLPSDMMGFLERRGTVIPVYGDPAGSTSNELCESLTSLGLSNSFVKRRHWMSCLVAFLHLVLSTFPRSNFARLGETWEEGIGRQEIPDHEATTSPDSGPTEDPSVS